MSTHHAMLAFNGGELSPYLTRRADFEKQPIGAELLENFLVTPYGSIIKRPPLRHLATTALVTYHSRLFPFLSSSGSRYLVHFTNGGCTIYRTDGTVADTLDFMDGYAWPSTWKDSLREMQFQQINDVAFITHPKTFPLRLSRLSDTSWTLEFIPFTYAPLKDWNKRRGKTFTVASNPVPNAWTSGTDYGFNQRCFTNCEWVCTADHTAASNNKPGSGANWRDYWTRAFFKEGDAITMLSDDVSLTSWKTGLRSYPAGTQFFRDNYRVELEDYTTAYGDMTRIVYAAGPDIGDPALVAYFFLIDSDVTAPEDGAIPPGDGTDWVGLEIVTPFEQGSGTTAWSEGDLCVHLGTIYRALSAFTINSTQPERHPDGVDTLTYWEVVVPANYASQTYDPNPSEETFGDLPHTNFTQSYTVGDIVAYKGAEYQCVESHFASPIDPPKDNALWSKVTDRNPAFLTDAFSPGRHYSIAPERDDQDFQIELRAIADNDGATTNPIAVDGAWTFNTYGTIWGRFILQRSINAGNTWKAVRTWEIKGDRNIAAGGEETEPALYRLKFEKITAPTTDPNDDEGGETSTSATDGPQRGVFEPDSARVTGHCLMTEWVDTDEMRGVALTGMLSGDTYRWAEGAFNSNNGFPRCLTFHEGRLIFAGSKGNPVSLWFSQSGDFLNFKTGVSDSDAIFATLALSNASPIRWVSSQRRLFIGTAYGEWVCGSETQDAPITPTNFLARQYDSKGSDQIPPVLAEAGLIFLERDGQRCRHMAYSETQNYAAEDLTRLAHHLSRAGIVSMAWQQTREPGLWCVTRSGLLLHFSFARADRVAAWSRHTTSGGLFRDVAVFPSDNGDDDIFFVVTRNGTSRLERFDQNWLDTFESGTIATYTDGNTASAITAKYTSCPIEIPTQNGTSIGRMKRAHKVILDTYRSAGGTLYINTAAAAVPILSSTQQTSMAEIVPDPGNTTTLRLQIIHSTAAQFCLRSAVVRLEVYEKD